MFLTSEDLTPYQLALTQKDPENKMMVWTNIQPTAKINRVVDIRWVFASEQEALTFHRQELIVNSEKMKEGALGNLSPIGKEFHVFLSDSGDKLLAVLGLDMKMYNFIFVVNSIVAKVFISGSDNLSLSEALMIAKQADHRIKRADAH